MHGVLVWWGNFCWNRLSRMKPVSGQEAELSATVKPIAGLVGYSWFNSLACHWFNSPNCPPGSADHSRPLASAEIAEVPPPY
jgi:hypothetical protein